jgi:hypothetical protein
MSDLYAALASGDPDAVRQFAPRVATLAEAARKQRASAPSPAASVPRAPASIAASVRAPAAPCPSRAAQVAEIHRDSINASRAKCGLAPLTSAELEREFVDVDREPTNTTTKKSARRAAANDMMRRQGLSTDQGSIDSIWAASAQKLNATLPSSSPRPASRAPQGQAAADAMWSSIVADGNRQAGLRTPVADRAR